MPAKRILSVRKLKTSEDEELQRQLLSISRADDFAKDIVIAGAIPDSDASWPRVDEAIEALSGHEPDDDGLDERERAAYYIGIAVGLRLAR